MEMALSEIFTVAESHSRISLTSLIEIHERRLTPKRDITRLINLKQKPSNNPQINQKPKELHVPLFGSSTIESLPTWRLTLASSKKPKVPTHGHTRVLISNPDIQSLWVKETGQCIKNTVNFSVPRSIH